MSAGAVPLSTVPAFGPSDANLSTAVGHLRASFPSEVEALLSGRYGCWLGSGISFARFPGLKSLVRDLLKEIYPKCDFTNATCPWRTCFQHILELIHIELDASRTTVPPDTWGDIDLILGQLVDRYSDVLEESVTVAGTRISLSWDILHLDQIYGNDGVDPDAEHILLAVLSAEGVFKELVTTNWDGLIEKAHSICCNGNGHALSVVVEACDIAGSRDAATRLTKVHGCACRCVHDPSKQSLMVATRSDIQNWKESHERQPLRDLVRTIVRERPALFIGLSAQDWNLQCEILGACKEAVGPLPDISKVLFAEPELRQPQRTVINHMLGAEAYAKDSQSIESGATLKLYSKPLLGALLIISLRRKLDVICAAGTAELGGKWQRFVEQSISDLDTLICSHFDSLAESTDNNALWRQLANTLPAFVARCNRLFLKYELPATEGEYYPLCPESVQELSARFGAEERPSLTWFVFTVASLYNGLSRGLWSILSAVGKEGTYGQFELEVCGKQIAIFIVPDSDTGKAKLANRKFIDDIGGRSAAILYVTGRRFTSGSHSPTHVLPYASPPHGPAEIWIQELAELHPHPDSLLDALKYELLRV